MCSFAGMRIPMGKRVGWFFNMRMALLFVAGLGLGSLIIGLQTANVVFFGGDVAIVERDQLTGTAITLTVLSFLAWAAVEELGFRSYALFRLKDAWGFWPAQIIVALAFAVHHLIAGFPLIPALLGTTVGSMAYGTAAIASRSVALPIGLHAAWNMGQWLLGEKEYPSPWRLEISETAIGNVQIAGVLGFYVLYGLLIVAFLRYHKTRERRSNMA